MLEILSFLIYLLPPLSSYILYYILIFSLVSTASDDIVSAAAAGLDMTADTSAGK